MSNELTPTARVILGMLKLGVRTGYDIKKAIDVSTRFFWTASFGQIYPELKRLRDQGLVEATEMPKGKVRRTVYSLTPKGEQVLHEWLTDSANMIFELRDEGLLRLFFGDLLTREEVLENLHVQQQLFGLVLERFRELEVQARKGFADESQLHPYLALRYGIDFIGWAQEWYADLERRLASAQSLSDLVELEDRDAGGGKSGLAPG